MSTSMLICLLVCGCLSQVQALPLLQDVVVPETELVAGVICVPQAPIWQSAQNNYEKVVGKPKPGSSVEVNSGLLGALQRYDQACEEKPQNLERMQKRAHEFQVIADDYIGGDSSFAKKEDKAKGDAKGDAKGNKAKKDALKVVKESLKAIAESISGYNKLLHDETTTSSSNGIPQQQPQEASTVKSKAQVVMDPPTQQTKPAPQVVAGGDQETPHVPPKASNTEKTKAQVVMDPPTQKTAPQVVAGGVQETPPHVPTGIKASNTGSSPSVSSGLH